MADSGARTSLAGKTVRELRAFRREVEDLHRNAVATGRMNIATHARHTLQRIEMAYIRKRVYGKKGLTVDRALHALSILLRARKNAAAADRLERAAALHVVIKQLDRWLVRTLHITKLAAHCAQH